MHQVESVPVRHEQTWVKYEELAQRPRRPFLPTYPESKIPAITDFLRAPTDGIKIDIGIRGSLQRDDAAKLYELAYHCQGDILELGTADGLSGAIMATAIVNSERPGKLISVDIDKRKHASATRTFARIGLDNIVKLITQDATQCCENLARDRKVFSLVFVDHSHEYTPVLEMCRILDSITAHGGFVLFHDYNDRRNAEGGDASYGVYQAVKDGLPSSFSFYGVYGCCGLYRHTGYQPLP